jgi:hypothetical protein
MIQIHLTHQPVDLGYSQCPPHEVQKFVGKADEFALKIGIIESGYGGPYVLVVAVKEDVVVFPI